MPKVMLRRGNTGKLVFYIAKQDLEDEVVSLQFDQPDKWGGELTLRDGSASSSSRSPPRPSSPVTVQAQRLGSA